MSRVRARGLTVTAASGNVLAGPVDLDLAGGTVTALVAPSGGGKSLVCRSLVGDLPTGVRLSGGPYVDGVEVAALGRGNFGISAGIAWPTSARIPGRRSIPLRQ
ncbi:hypothetical protein [Mycolicibacterium mageritense]|uniref:hypothetical protein n=1 Tax=Mycolicibacterium mageritense TaxID=53462 RepID=UPI001E5BC1CF|nr:hypothetical protein [Mycolicibacterium mageritense]MCC9179816.1 hypothetical protein [Mycolicibacterium mageritense]